jgi:2-polyprenyl-3-methyl-5-hydroxy-6-metoxy-1,4-benzoquinol methylase
MTTLASAPSIGSAVLAPVQRQYEVLPYPHRDPEQELEQLRQPTMCELPRIQGLLWGRRRDLSGFRVLDAGCGTGDNTVFLAEQLRGTGAEIVALDFSKTSLEINRARLAKRGLESVRHVLASIEDAPSLDLGEFDYIVCSGVLHHLASPETGLSALRSMLTAEGMLAVMVYATYGREPVYLMQGLMKRLAPTSLDPERRLRILKYTIAGLPPTSRTARGLLDSPNFRAEITQSDAGAYDLLLHTQDRSYTVPEIQDWLHGAGMRLAEWSVPKHYDPVTYLDGVSLTHLSADERYATAELMHGGMTKHEFFAERDDAPERIAAAPNDRDAVPAWCGWDFPKQLAAALPQIKGGQEFRCSFGSERDVTVKGDALGRYFLEAIDGTRSVGEILDGASSVASAVSATNIRKRWVEFATSFRAVAALVLFEG